MAEMTFTDPATAPYIIKHPINQPTTPVHVSTKSTTQYPLMGTYCFVIILMASCATSPPRNADVVGMSAVGERALRDR